MNINYEKRALKIGLVINVLCAIIGLVFFILTKSLSIFLDSFISVILCVSTFISMKVSSSSSQEPSSKYPLGRYAIENIFLLFRSLMLITTILISFISGGANIIDFALKKQELPLYMNNTVLIVYAVLMSGLCFMITMIYKHYNKKLNNQSNIIRIEITDSLFDGLVTIVAISSLLAFSNIPFLQPISTIGDSITVIILSACYIIKPIKELIQQVSILTDRRIHIDQEKELKRELGKSFDNLNFYDVYLCYTGNMFNIYITFLPKNKQDLQNINVHLGNLSKYLYERYDDSAQVYLHCTKKALHLL